MVAWCAVAALVLGRFGGRCDSCDLVNIGRPYWIALGVMALLILVLLHLALKRRWRGVAITMVCLAAASIDGAVPDARACVPGDAMPHLRIVAFNAWKDNVAPQRAAQWLRRAQPDVIVLVEAQGSAASISALLSADFPYRVACNAAMRCSTQILSRLRPIQSQSWARGDAENRKVLSATAMTLPISAQRSVTIVGVHLSRLLPLGQQRHELSTLSRHLAALDSAPLIVAGDFNATITNASLRDFAAIHRLESAPTGPTWPTPVVLAGVPSLIAIDHILVNEKIGVATSMAGPVIGSDHRPILAALCITP